MTQEQKKRDKQVGFMVNSETYEQAQSRLNWGEMSDRLRTTVQEIAYGTETTERRRLKEKLERLRDEKREIENEIQSLRNDRDKKEREISRVEERLDVLMDKSGEYNAILEAIEEDLHDGKRFDPQHGQVELAAEKGECTPKDVINDLKERNDGVPEIAFRTANLSEPPNWKDALDKQGED